MSRLPPFQRMIVKPTSGGGSKRRRVDFNCGDRYCSSCGHPIYGQATEEITCCPHGSCKKPLQLERGKFIDHWGRCVCFSCFAFIQDTMLYCQLCGIPNAVAFEKRERKEKAARLSEEAKQKEKMKELEAERAKLQEALRERDEIIKAQEDEIMEARLLKMDDNTMVVDQNKLLDNSMNEEQNVK